jgi:hypothetical protein
MAKVSLKQRALHVAIALDQVLYVAVTLGRGSPDETLSSAAYRANRNQKRISRYFAPAIDYVWWKLFGEVDHCWHSFLAEVYSTQLSAEVLAERRAR